MYSCEILISKCFLNCDILFINKWSAMNRLSGFNAIEMYEYFLKSFEKFCSLYLKRVIVVLIFFWISLDIKELLEISKLKVNVQKRKKCLYIRGRILNLEKRILYCSSGVDE